MMTRALSFLRVLVLLGMLYFVAIAPIQSASADHNNSWGYVDMGSSDYVYNYDFFSEDFSEDNLDWPVTIIFANNAEIDRVKNDLRPHGFNETGSSKKGRVSDSSTSGFVWDSDRGLHQDACPVQAHYRVYAPADDRLGYNTTLGYFIIATTHQDRYHHNWCPPGTEAFGWSETASNTVRTAAIQAYGSSNVDSNSINMRNRIPAHWSGTDDDEEDDRYWQNSGYAHRINVPSD